MSFEWPWQYNFPPFFTLQPNVDTRQKQLAAWCSLALTYCRHHKLYTLDIMEAQESPVFNNKKIERIIKTTMNELLIVLTSGNLEWLDKNKSRCLVMWRRPEEWGKLIYQWVSHQTERQVNIFIFPETSQTNPSRFLPEFHGLEEWMLLRSLQALQSDGKAEIITMDEGKGVKFF
uniref:Vacuolar protein-sorting-associated protein 25 n=1 Tax=Cynoglossus semilaevis TaxID=244447 RepID=A0A3P8VD48_CYNSE